jgi:membrane protein DedA with SNARE-associated domain
MAFADFTNMVLEFVRQHPNWAAFIVFGLSLGESLPFVSLVLPFWAMLVGIGTIIAVADPLIFWTIVAAAAIGAALGDWLSYWVGYHYHAQIQQLWPLKNSFRRWSPPVG